MSGYESNFLAIARRVADSFDHLAHSRAREATALERIASAMEQANRLAHPPMEPPPDTRVISTDG